MAPQEIPWEAGQRATAPHVAVVPEIAVGPQQSHCPVRPQTHWKQGVKAGLLVTNNKNRLEQMNTEKGPQWRGLKQLSEAAETWLGRNPGGQPGQEAPPAACPSLKAAILQPL